MEPPPRLISSKLRRHIYFQNLGHPVFFTLALLAIFVVLWLLDISGYVLEWKNTEVEPVFALYMALLGVLWFVLNLTRLPGAFQLARDGIPVKGTILRNVGITLHGLDTVEVMFEHDRKFHRRKMVNDHSKTKEVWLLIDPENIKRCMYLHRLFPEEQGEPVSNPGVDAD